MERRSINKDRFTRGEWTRFRAKNYPSVRFCSRSRPMTKFLNVCENFARNVGHVKQYCPFTRSSFCNISQTLRTFRKECFFFFRRVKRTLHVHVIISCLSTQTPVNSVQCILYVLLHNKRSYICLRRFVQKVLNNLLFINPQPLTFISGIFKY